MNYESDDVLSFLLKWTTISMETSVELTTDVVAASQKHECPLALKTLLHVENDDLRKTLFKSLVYARKKKIQRYETLQLALVSSAGGLRNASDANGGLHSSTRFSKPSLKQPRALSRTLSSSREKENFTHL